MLSADERNLFSYVMNGISLQQVRAKAEHMTIRAMMIGYHLDNMIGDSVRVEAIMRGNQEYVLSMETFKESRPKDKKFHTGHFNLANMIAAIRQLDERTVSAGFFLYETDLRAALRTLKEITWDCREDMKSPDLEKVVTTVCDTYYDSLDERRMTIRIARDDLMVELGLIELLQMVQESQHQSIS